MRKITCLITILIGSATAPAADAANGIQLVRVYDVFNAIQAAQDVELAAYSLQPTSAIVDDLASAGDRGATVTVYLDRDARGEARTANAQTRDTLISHHVTVRYSTIASHIKTAIVGGTVYLSDRNWSTRGDEEIVVVDSIPADRTLVENAIRRGQTGGNDHFWTRKSDAIDAEARVILSRSTRDLLVESESFGAGTPVYAALIRRAKLGDRVRLIVAENEYSTSYTEQHAVAGLMEAGVDVRIGSADEKMAVDGDAVFLGSANATRGVPAQLEFGIALRDLGIANQLHTQFENEWSAATDLTPH